MSNADQIKSNNNTILHQNRPAYYQRELTRLQDSLNMRTLFAGCLVDKLEPKLPEWSASDKYAENNYFRQVVTDLRKRLAYIKRLIQDANQMTFEISNFQNIMTVTNQLRNYTATTNNIHCDILAKLTYNRI